jgi:hypothetical protein
MVKKVISIISLLSIILLSNVMAKDITSNTRNNNSTISKYDLSQQDKIDILNQIHQHAVSNNDDTVKLFTDKELYARAIESISALNANISNNGSIFLLISIDSSCESMLCDMSCRNCPEWLYEKKGDNYRLLISGPNLSIAKNITNGYRDIEATQTWHVNPMDGSSEGGCEVYKYDGSVYKQTERWITKNGKKTKRNM